MSKVISVSVTGQCHSPLQQPKHGCSKSGKSNIDWTFKGIYSDHGKCVVVVEAGVKRDGRGCRVNPDQDGGIFAAGSTGVYCELVTDSGDMENWSVSVSTDKEENPIDEVVFQAGAGIAPVNKG